MDLSSAPIAIAAHSRRLSSLASCAFAPWQSTSARSTVCPPQISTQEATAQMHLSPTSLGFQFGSPSNIDISTSLRAKGIYDASRLEQEHCTGYECCNVKLPDMHAVMDHAERAHRRSRLGQVPLHPYPRPQVFRQRHIITPVLPALPARLDDDYDLSSAPSPCPSSTTCSDRSRSSFSVMEDDTEFTIDMGSPKPPQTPPVGLHPGQPAVTIVRASGESNTSDGINAFHFNPSVQPTSSHYGVESGAFEQPCPQKQASATFFPVVQVPATPAFQVSYGQVAPETRPAIQLQVPLTAANTILDADFILTPDTPALDSSFYSPTVVIPSPLTPSYSNLIRYQQLQPPPVRQNPSFHQPQPFAFGLQGTRPLAPSPSPTLASIHSQPQPDMYAIRANLARSDSLVSMKSVLPQPIVTPTLYATSVKRSFDDMEGTSPEEQGDFDEDEDEDAEGEAEVVGNYCIASAPVLPVQRHPVPSQPREKKAKTGRPRGSGTRASAQKDPKRAKLFCPKEGCTKRYMNPNGLKYHLEKGTCTFDS